MLNLLRSSMSVGLLFLLISGILFPTPIFAAEGDTGAAVDAATTDAVKSVVSSAGVLGVFGGLIGSGIIVFGAALGISRIASGATEAIARQPEAGGRIFTSMVISASLIEGVAFFGLIVCFVAIILLT